MTYFKYLFNVVPFLRRCLFSYDHFNSMFPLLHLDSFTFLFLVYLQDKLNKIRCTTLWCFDTFVLTSQLACNSCIDCFSLSLQTFLTFFMFYLLPLQQALLYYFYNQIIKTYLLSSNFVQVWSLYKHQEYRITYNALEWMLWNWTGEPCGFRNHQWIWNIKSVEKT
jgi:hypothetical protein